MMQDMEGIFQLPEPVLSAVGKGRESAGAVSGVVDVCRISESTDCYFELK